MQSDNPNLTNVCLVAMKVLNGWRNIPLPDQERNCSKENYILNKLWQSLILIDEIEIAYCYYNEFFNANRCLNEHILISEVDDSGIEFNLILNKEETNCNANGLKIKIPAKSVLNSLLIEIKIKSNSLDIFPNDLILEKVGSLSFPFNDVINENISAKDLPNYIVIKKSNVGFFFKKLSNLKGIFDEYIKMITSGLKRNMSGERLYFIVCIEKISNNLLAGKLIVASSLENNQLPNNTIHIEDLNEIFLMSKSEIIDISLEINDGWSVWRKTPLTVKISLLNRGYQTKSHFILKKTLENTTNCTLKILVNLRKSKKNIEEIIDLEKRCLNEQSNYALTLIQKKDVTLNVKNATLNLPFDCLSKNVIPSICIWEEEQKKKHECNALVILLKSIPNDAHFKKSANLSLKMSNNSPKIITSVSGAVVDYKCEENSCDISLEINSFSKLTIRDGIVIFGHVVGIPLESNGTIIDIYLARKNIFAPKSKYDKYSISVTLDLQIDDTIPMDSVSHIFKARLKNNDDDDFGNNIESFEKVCLLKDLVDVPAGPTFSWKLYDTQLEDINYQFIIDYGNACVSSQLLRYRSEEDQKKVEVKKYLLLWEYLTIDLKYIGKISLCQLIRETIANKMEKLISGFNRTFKNLKEITIDEIKESVYQWNLKSVNELINDIEILECQQDLLQEFESLKINTYVQIIRNLKSKEKNYLVKYMHDKLIDIKDTNWKMLYESRLKRGSFSD
ncbi:DgyrCDS2168 [Dimorphilus gyrociliatus]|uniref:DgyrCDS2168 n=1 Tax=Dimorphilus gyrociliatus TaxID=2664684 RepID=A0A7I8VBF0_9ANNE|nr:DgyrCDS2168 [Dimorphilus gyrociliatus]